MFLQSIVGVMSGVGIAAVVAVGVLFYLSRQSEPTRTRNVYRKPRPNYVAYPGAEADAVCSICLEMPEGRQRMQVRCGHVFHQTCIDRWQQTDVRCPNCRERL